MAVFAPEVGPIPVYEHLRERIFVRWRDSQVAAAPRLGLIPPRDYRSEPKSFPRADAGQRVADSFFTHSHVKIPTENGCYDLKRERILTLLFGAGSLMLKYIKISLNM
jgi:hypothetical protein